MYTTQQAAKILNITAKTVTDYIRKGYLKAKKLGRDWFISKTEVKKRLKKSI